MTKAEMDRGQAIAFLKEDIHNLNQEATDNEYTQSLMVDLQTKLLEILEPAEWWADFSGHCDVELHGTAYAYFPAMERDALEMLLWCLHRLTNAELLQLVKVLDSYAHYDYANILKRD